MPHSRDILLEGVVGAMVKLAEAVERISWELLVIMEILIVVLEPLAWIKTTINNNVTQTFGFIFERPKNKMRNGLRKIGRHFYTSFQFHSAKHSNFERLYEQVSKTRKCQPKTDWITPACNKPILMRIIWLWKLTQLFATLNALWYILDVNKFCGGLDVSAKVFLSYFYLVNF